MNQRLDMPAPVAIKLPATMAPLPLPPAERARLSERIKRLLKERDAVFVAHYYVDEDLQRLAEETGGCVADCANAQNCVKACPKDIPLTESIAEVNRQAWKQALLGWLIG